MRRKRRGRDTASFCYPSGMEGNPRSVSATLPRAITVCNYRCFAEPLRLELRPLTLLFGINNAGKSALLRLLPLLSTSVGPDTNGPLNMEHPALRGCAFNDLRWYGLEEDDKRDLGITFHWDDDDQETSSSFDLTWFDKWRRLIIRRLVVRTGDGPSLLDAEFHPRPDERTSARLSYEIGQAGRQPVSEMLGFQGLAPERAGGYYSEVLDPIGDRLRAFGNQVLWLEAARKPPQRITTHPSSPRWRMKPDGSDAAAALAGNPELLTEVSGWYERHLGRRLHIRELAGGFKLMLVNQTRTEIDVDLCDTGEGMTQVLPVLLARALARRHADGGPLVLAIEKPESHLHPSLQRTLAEEICSLAAIDSAPRVVLETQSEQLLLGVQLQIVSGQLSPDDVQMYWVRQLAGGRSVADPVTFDEDARQIGNWPPGVFSDDMEVAREIIRRRRERAKEC